MWAWLFISIASVGVFALSCLLLLLLGPNIGLSIEGDPARLRFEKLMPGEQVETTYVLKNNFLSGELDLEVEVGDQDGLMPFVRVDIFFDGKKDFGGTLFDASHKIFTTRIDDEVEARLVYTIASDAGTDAGDESLDLGVEFSLHY